MNLASDLARQESVAQWLEHPNGLWKVMVSFPVGSSDFYARGKSNTVTYYVFLVEMKN